MSMPNIRAWNLGTQINMSLSPEGVGVTPVMQQSMMGDPTVSSDAHATCAESVRSDRFSSAAANRTSKFAMSSLLVFTENINS